MRGYCEICGNRYAEDTHHLIYGRGLRKLADEDKLTLKVCGECHKGGNDSIHGNTAAGQLSKMVGQAMWESRAIANGKTQEQAREEFMKRYGRSWL